VGGRRKETKGGFHFRNGFKTFFARRGGNTDGWYGVGERGGYKTKGEAQESGGIGREVRGKERIGRKGDGREREPKARPQSKGVKDTNTKESSLVKERRDEKGNEKKRLLVLGCLKG